MRTDEEKEEEGGGNGVYIKKLELRSEVAVGSKHVSQSSL